MTLQRQTTETPLDVCHQTKDAVTIACTECGVLFTPHGQQKFCAGACRQKAYRKSPSHKRILAGQKQQRLNRRNAWLRLRTRDKAIAPIHYWSGPESTVKIPLGSLDLTKFSKEPEGIRGECEVCQRTSSSMNIMV